MASDEGLGKKVLSIGKKTGEITQEKMLKALDWSYEATLNGLPGQKTVDDFKTDKRLENITSNPISDFDKTENFTESEMNLSWWENND